VENPHLMVNRFAWWYFDLYWLHVMMTHSGPSWAVSVPLAKGKVRLSSYVQWGQIRGEQRYSTTHCEPLNDLCTDECTWKTSPLFQFMFLLLFSWRYNPLRLYFPQPGSQL
jgi:hypothetical protein